MNTIEKTRRPAKVSTSRALPRASSAMAVLAIVTAAISVPVIAPQTTNGASPVVAIARADCPPDCGPGGGGTPSGPPGGGTEFVPPSMPSMPSYEPGRGQPALDQNNGVSIYNSAAPQPSQAAQPSQAPAQNQDGSYNRAANGEQQPVQYSNAPNNQQLNNDWQKLSDQLNNPQNQPGQQQPEQESDKQKTDRTCESVLRSMDNKFIFGSGEPKLSPEAVNALLKAGLRPEQCTTQEAAVRATLKESPLSQDDGSGNSSNGCNTWNVGAVPMTGTSKFSAIIQAPLTGTISQSC